jgi:hypothetical protein
MLGMWVDRRPHAAGAAAYLEDSDKAIFYMYIYVAIHVVSYV